ncbi:hypothetical protein H8K35_12130 [Undibacterium sp. LX40W]|uniref:Uncharacterized protein n=1 Tax=Undibacterium nitidum TaxID=2762298 RepID=A0A923HPF1_9BURK|nr:MULTISPECIES: hypothetical protein [Undibacterium]MBC3882133.1 hypothetical protein [Undibacterium nitidum]MBC3892414.1 hypothetical protein [Undibacterium sp. LX40W]
MENSLNFVFRPHGKFKVWIENQFLLTEVTGPWNRELVDYWAQHALPLAKSFSSSLPYVAITTVHESILCPPDALERIAQVVQYALKNLPCLGHAIVANDTVSGRDIVRFSYEKIQIEHIFENIEQAKTWGKEVLDKAKR